MNHVRSARLPRLGALLFMQALLLLVLLSSLVTPASAGVASAPSQRLNQYPIALVHGFFGWGRDELLGWKHFGGFTDLQEVLKSSGYQVVTPAMGPISSNWDRAAELYAQLVGGCTDYGAAHAAEHHHARFGRCYQALLPGLGTLDASGHLRKVNLIAHSQGGPTARVLIELLAHGSAAEKATGVADLSPLFAGTGSQFVHALGTLSAANDGSLLAHTIYHNIDFENELISGLVSLVNTIGADAVYDFKLDQFGLGPRKSGESFADYTRRAMGKMLSEGNKDTAFWDLSADGAKQVNQFASAELDVYYFSVANNTTFRGWLTGFEYPEWVTNPLLSPTTLFMGTYAYRYAPGAVAIGKDWWKNDGVVSTRSMSAPINGSADRLVSYSGSIQRGAWNYLGEQNGWDHWDMLGLLDFNHSASSSLIPMYQKMAAFLAASPVIN